MKKLIYLGFCLVLVSGVGCAITNYDLITDSDQVANGQGSGVVNTNGKAHIIESSQIATLWPDGSDELFSMVDQKANGDRTITTYNNFSTGDDPTFHDDLYCNPDWAGCAIWTAPDPEDGDSDIFDGSFNTNCSGARSLSLLLSTGRYYGECGRATITPDLSDRIALLNMGDVGEFMGMSGLWFGYDHNNLTINVNGNILPVADGSLFADPVNRRGVLNVQNPLNASTLRAFSSVAKEGDIVDVSVTYNGIVFERTVKVFRDANALANIHY